MTDPLNTRPVAIPAGWRLTERKVDDECGCPEEVWDTPFGELHMHLSAGKPSNACLDNGDEGERHIDLTVETIAEARAAIFGWVVAYTPRTDISQGAGGGGWRPFKHQRDVPTDGSWFVARTTKPGWSAVRIVHYASKSDRLPIDRSGWVWPSEPTEWMPLTEYAAALATPPTPAADAAEVERLRGALGRIARFTAKPLVGSEGERSATLGWNRAREWACRIALAALRSEPQNGSVGVGQTFVGPLDDVAGQLA